MLYRRSTSADPAARSPFHSALLAACLVCLVAGNNALPSSGQSHTGSLSTLSEALDSTSWPNASSALEGSAGQEPRAVSASHMGTSNTPKGTRGMATSGAALSQQQGSIGILALTLLHRASATARASADNSAPEHGRTLQQTTAGTALSPANSTYNVSDNSTQNVTSSTPPKTHSSANGPQTPVNAPSPTPGSPPTTLMISGTSFHLNSTQGPTSNGGKLVQYILVSTTNVSGHVSVVNLLPRAPPSPVKKAASAPTGGASSPADGSTPSR